MPKSLFMLVVALSLVASQGRAQEVTPDDVIDATVGDWNRDGQPDLALLAADDAGIGVYVYLREAETEGGLLKLALSAPDKVWGRSHSGGMVGQEPFIRALENGSIAVTEQNTGIGQDRWEVVRTIAWRGGAFVVAGFTLMSWNSLDEEDALTCDLNMLTGKGLVNDRPVRFDPSAIRLEDWPNDVEKDPALLICRKE